LPRRKRNSTKSTRQRHKLRINAKKLRYAGEFFASLFPGGKSTKRRRVFAKALKRLQGSLGDLNDFAVHGKLADRLVFAKGAKARGKHTRHRAFAAGVVAGDERVRSGLLLKTAKDALRDVAAAKPYWPA
jgi:CHAD domain-containing protein